MVKNEIINGVLMSFNEKTQQTKVMNEFILTREQDVCLKQRCYVKNMVHMKIKFQSIFMASYFVSTKCQDGTNTKKIKITFSSISSNLCSFHMCW